MLRRWIGCFATIVVALVASAQPAAAQPRYTYTVIADTSSCNTVSAPVIGNNGEAAFIARCPTPQDSFVVRKGDGQILTDIYVWKIGVSGFYGVADPGILSINDQGVVAFSGGPTGGGSTGYAILFGDGGPLSVAADTSVQTQWKNVHRPSINNSLSVAFGAIPTSGPNIWNTVIRADGTVFTTIAEPGLSAPGAGTILDASEPALNNAGQVEFTVNTVEGVSGIFRGSGGTLTKIVTSAGNAFSGINDAGRVAFASGNFVKSGTGGTLTTIAASGTLFHSFTGVAAINNSNAVAFGAQTQAGPFGIFVGDGVVTQPVVQTGDVLSGLGAVTWVATSEEAINDAGQVAFGLQYNDGSGVKSAIVRADPILPQITQLKLNATVAGCKPASATVVLDRPAPPGGVVIEIEETNAAASAPATLKIASGKPSGTFKLSTTPVAAKATGTVTASLGSSEQSKPLTVRPMSVQSVTLNPTSVVGGNPVTGTVTLECAAAPGDITVLLASNKPGVAQPAVSSLLFTAGTKVMTFSINTTSVAASTTAKITAAANGITKSKNLTVTP